MKRLLLVVLVLLVLMIGAAFAIPILYKDKIVATAKEEINKSINATVDFKDVSLSLFRNFPQLYFELQDYSVTGNAPFEGVNLAKGKSVGLSLDLYALLFGSGPLKIQSIELIAPTVNIQVLESGTANYDIALPSDAPTTPNEEADYSGFAIELERYKIEEANITYSDKSIDTDLEILGLEHEGSGQFTIDVYDLNTTTAIKSISVQQGGINYLNKARIALEAIFNIDQDNSKYTFKENELSVNALKLHADGYVQLKEDDIAMDLAIGSPQNDFKSLLSLIPSAYVEGYEAVKADGTFKINGLVRGTYNGEKETYPAFKLNLDAENANVKYPDLPLGIENIVAKVGINSPTSNFDDMIVNIPMLRMKVGNNPFKATFRLEHPISDPDIDTQIDGVIDLGDIAKAFPVEGMETLKGIIRSDVRAKTRMSYIDKGQYDQVDMSGDVIIEDLVYQSEGLPAIQINSADAQFTPQRVNLKDFDAQLGKSDIQAEGTIDNVLAYFSPENTMEGALNVRSTYFNADEWMEESESTETAEASSYSSGEGTDYEVFDRFNFAIDAEATEIDYDVYKLKNTSTKGQISPSKMTIERFSSELGKSDLAGSGTITNVFDYVFDGETLGGDLKFRSAFMDLNQFMTTEEVTTSTEGGSTETYDLEAIRVPANLDITLDTKIDKVLYDNMELRDVRGDLIIENETVVLDNVVAEALGGTINMSGGYDTKDHNEPKYNIKYDLQKLDFRETFNTLNTFQAIAPIGQFLEGNFTTSLIMDGSLGQDLMPILTSLNAQGYLQTLNAFLSNFKPLQAVGNTLGIKEFTEKLKIKGTKNWFEIKDGKVEVKEFDYAVEDIDMKISGFHGLTRDMEYTIKAKIPRSYLESNSIGSAAASGLDALSSQANKLGLNLKQSEFVNVLINLTGSIADPKVGFKLLGTDGEASVADAAKAQIKEELNAQKEELLKEGKEELDEQKEALQEEAQKEIDQAKAQAEAAVKEEKEKLKEQIGKEAEQKASEILGEKGKESTDKIKEELDKFNPFKKKKKKKEDGGGR